MATSRPRVAPYLTVSPAAAAIGFYTAVFHAKQKAFMPALDGMRIAHCELEINGGAVMVADAFPDQGLTRTPVPGDFPTMSISLEFDSKAEVDETLKRALALGAKTETGPTDSFWGTRMAVFKDPFGHRWVMNAPLR